MRAVDSWQFTFPHPGGTREGSFAPNPRGSYGPRYVSLRSRGRGLLAPVSPRYAVASPSPGGGHFVYFRLSLNAPRKAPLPSTSPTTSSRAASPIVAGAPHATTRRRDHHIEANAPRRSGEPETCRPGGCDTEDPRQVPRARGACHVAAEGLRNRQRFRGNGHLLGERSQRHRVRPEFHDRRGTSKRGTGSTSASPPPTRRNITASAASSSGR